MSSFQRIQNIVIGLITIVIAISMMALPERGYGLAALLISISFAFSGLRTLIYYFTMARFMVGGKRILFRGLILLDLGLFTFTLIDNSKIYVILYLVIIHAISGAISIVKSLQEKKDGASWKLSRVSGTVNLLMALFCIVFIGSTDMIVFIFGAGLTYSGIMRLISAFRRTAIVYV